MLFICNLFSHETLEHVVCWHTLLTMKRKLSVSDEHIYLARFHAHVHLHLISTSGLEQRETLWQVRFIKYQYSHKIERYECSVKVQVCLHQNLLHKQKLVSCDCVRCLRRTPLAKMPHKMKMTPIPAAPAAPKPTPAPPPGQFP